VQAETVSLSAKWMNRTVEKAQSKEYICAILDSTSVSVM
jgi:hypothetical protein